MRLRPCIGAEQLHRTGLHPGRRTILQSGDVIIHVLPGAWDLCFGGIGRLSPRPTYFIGRGQSRRRFVRPRFTSGGFWRRYSVGFVSFRSVNGKNETNISSSYQDSSQPGRAALRDGQRIFLHSVRAERGDVASAPHDMDDQSNDGRDSMQGGGLRGGFCGRSPVGAIYVRSQSIGRTMAQHLAFRRLSHI